MNLAELGKDLVVRLYMSLDEVIEKYPMGITVNGLRVNNGRDGKYYTLTFDEDEGVYIPASSGSLKKMVESWLNAFTAEEIEEYFKHHRLYICFDKVKTQKGNTYVRLLKCEQRKYSTILNEELEEVDIDTGEVHKSIIGV